MQNKPATQCQRGQVNATAIIEIFFGYLISPPSCKYMGI
jgi:hypothetical protein